MNAIVYSIYLIGDDPNVNQAYYQMLYSIDTLRKYSQIPVKIFVTPQDVLDKVERDVREISNVEVIYFDNDVKTMYPSYVDWGFARLLDHRWKNVLKTFELFPAIQRVLFLDGDTIFHGPAETLFMKYASPHAFYVRKDVTPHISEKIGLNFGMNDGQFIISRSIANKLAPGFYLRQQEMIKSLLTNSEKLLDAQTHRHLHWLSVQYTTYQRLMELKIPINDFAKSDVMLSNEPTHTHSANCRPTHLLHHYFSGNMHLYLPKEYWTVDRAPTLTAQMRGKRLCSCGRLEVQ